MLLDKVITATLLEKSNMLSVNQLNAQIKFLEIWKESEKKRRDYLIILNVTLNPLKQLIVVKMSESDI